MKLPDMEPKDRQLLIVHQAGLNSSSTTVRQGGLHCTTMGLWEVGVNKGLEAPALPASTSLTGYAHEIRGEKAMFKTEHWQVNEAHLGDPSHLLGDTTHGDKISVIRHLEEGERDEQVHMKSF